MRTFDNKFRLLLIGVFILCMLFILGIVYTMIEDNLDTIVSIVGPIVLLIVAVYVLSVAHPVIFYLLAVADGIVWSPRSSLYVQSITKSSKENFRGELRWAISNLGLKNNPAYYQDDPQVGWLSLFSNIPLLLVLVAGISFFIYWHCLVEK